MNKDVGAHITGPEQANFFAIRQNHTALKCQHVFSLSRSVILRILGKATGRLQWASTKLRKATRICCHTESQSPA